MRQLKLRKPNAGFMQDQRNLLMKKYLPMLLICVGAGFSPSVMGGPVSADGDTLKSHMAQGIVRVLHCRNLSGICDDYTGTDTVDKNNHSRYWSHQRRGSSVGSGVHSRYWSERRRAPDRDGPSGFWNNRGDTHSRYWSERRERTGEERHDRSMSHERWGSENNGHRRYLSRQGF